MFHTSTHPDTIPSNPIKWDGLTLLHPSLDGLFFILFLGPLPPLTLITTSRHDEEPAGRGEAGEDGDQHSALAGQVQVISIKIMPFHLFIKIQTCLFTIIILVFFSGRDLKATAHQLAVSGIKFDQILQLILPNRILTNTSIDFTK